MANNFTETRLSDKYWLNIEELKRKYLGIKDKALVNNVLTDNNFIKKHNKYKNNNMKYI